MRATAFVPGKPLTPAGVRALLALVEQCPGPGDESQLPQLAEAIGQKAGAARLALEALGRRGLATAYDDGQAWSPTFSGRARAAALPA